MSGKVFKTNQESEQVILEVCPACKKPKTAESRKGSFTSYIFAANRCQCLSTNQTTGESTSQLSPAPDNNTAPKEAKNLDSPKPDLGKRYEVLQLLGEGGMGAVWQVRDRQIEKTLAIKILRPELALDRIAVKRFEQEVEAAAFLTQVNLVAVYGSGKTADDCPYMIMDYLEGKNLSEILREETLLKPEKVMEITGQICDALIHAHAKGVVHRDLKPSNIIITNENVVKIVDFGIAKVMSSLREQTEDLTQTGDLFGSPLYMSPEQCSGEAIDNRSDIYALGCIIYEMLSGKPAFAAENPIKIILKQISEKPSPLSKTLIPSGLLLILDRCLAKNPDDRYWSCQELAEDLEAVKAGGQPLKREEKTKLQLLGKANASRRFYAMATDSVISGIFAASVGLLMVGITWYLNMPNWPDHTPKPYPILQNAYWTLPLCFFILGVIDGTISICLPLFLILACLDLIDLPNHMVDQLDFTRTLISNFLTLTSVLLLGLFSWLYHACNESSKSGATIGKKLLNLKISTPTGQSLSFAKTSLRHISKLLTPLVSLFQTKEPLYLRPFHDRLSKAYVIEDTNNPHWIEPPLVTAVCVANVTTVITSSITFIIFLTSGYRGLPNVPGKDIVTYSLLIYIMILAATYFWKARKNRKESL